jgi:hypothetical protein
MSPTMHDSLESDLRALFERQADALPVTAREWDDIPITAVVAIPPTRRTRPAFAAIVATAAAFLLVLGIATIRPGRGVFVAGQPGAPVPLHLATRQVRLAADAMSIEAGGRHFTAGGSAVELNSDPGTPDKYTTIELVWTEGGTEMRLNIYFTSDGRDWWANEIRTSDGGSPGDWIEYTGTFFRAPLGRAFVGNVDLRADDGHGRLKFSNLQLQPFLPAPACKGATTKYVLDPSYDKADMAAGADGFGIGTTALLDTTTCTAVANPQAYAFDWAVENPAVVKLETYDDIGKKNVMHEQLTGQDPRTPIDLYRAGPGATVVRLSARFRATGAVVATATIPVTVH